MPDGLLHEQVRMLLLKHEGIEISGVDTDGDQLFVIETHIPSGFRSRWEIYCDLFSRIAFRTQIPIDLGAFSNSLADPQHGHDATKRFRCPRMFRDPEHRLDADMHVVPIVLPSPLKQSDVSKPSDDVRNEDILYGALKFRDRILVDHDVQPFAHLVWCCSLLASTGKRSQMNQCLNSRGGGMIFGSDQQTGQTLSY